jgi:hypothetical protein
VALAEVTSASATTRKAWSGRLFGLRQLLFEQRRLAGPPRRGPIGASIGERLAVVPAVEIRRSIERYVQARSAVLARLSVEGLVNDLIPFGVFLGDRFPDIRELRQLERHHVEAFMVWNRTRPWRGRVARAQLSASVTHSAVLSLRNFLDNICLWGWADPPPGVRQRCPSSAQTPPASPRSRRRRRTHGRRGGPRRQLRPLGDRAVAPWWATCR